LAVAKTRQPAIFAICIAAVPTPAPAPRIKTSSPGRMLPLLTIMLHAVRNTSGAAAASSNDSESGIGRTTCAGTLTSWAYAPSAAQNIDMVDRCGVDLNNHFAAASRRFRHIFVTKHVGRPVFVKNDCFHDQRLVYPTKMIDEKNVRSVVVVGAGIMGTGIAHVAA